MDDSWTHHGKVRAREAEGFFEIVVDGLTTQSKYYKPLVYEFFRKAWRGSRPAWGEFSVEILMEYVGDPPWIAPDNLAKAILAAIKGYAFHDDAQVARLLVERRAGERERIVVAVRKLSDANLLGAPYEREKEGARAGCRRARFRKLSVWNVGSAILLKPRGAQASQAMAVDRFLPSEEFLVGQGVALARLIQGQQPAADGGHHLGFAPDNPAPGVCRRQILQRQRRTRRADDISLAAAVRACLLLLQHGFTPFRPSLFGSNLAKGP